MKIDLKTTPTERLDAEEIFAYFEPSLKFDRIVERDTFFIMGPKGSGKSMILNYLSFSVQLERFKSKNLIEYDKSNFGIYVRCNEHYFGTIREVLGIDDKPMKSWQDRFTHIFNLTTCEIIVKNLEIAKNYSFFIIKPEEERETCMEIREMLNLESQDDFKSLQRSIRMEIRGFSRKNADAEDKGFTINSFLSELQTTLQELISDFKNRWLVILLDEYHELTDAQQQIISEILSVRKPVFKIASLPLQLTTERQTHDRYIELTREFQFVNIGTKNLSSTSDGVGELGVFFKNMANKRLSRYNLNIETLFSIPSEKEKTKSDIPKSDLEQKTLFDANNFPVESDKNIGYAGFDNYVLLSSGNARTFLDLLNITLSAWTGDQPYISSAIQQRALKEYATELMDGIDFIPAISVYLFRSLILKIGLLFKNYLKTTKRNYLQIGIKDPENLSNEAIKILTLAIKRSYLMTPALERSSRGGIKLLSLTLHNSLLPYFDLPLKTHQVCELSANDIEQLIDRRSSIQGTEIKMAYTKGELKRSKESLVPYLDLVNEIGKHIKNKELILFIGSGLSTELGYPTGKLLARKIAEHFHIEYVGEDLTTIVERVLLKRQRGDLIKFIKSELEKSKTKESRSYKMIVDFDMDQIFTTNWDNSIEEEIKIKIPTVEKIVRDEHLLIVGNKKPLVYKIHGDFDHPDMIVITGNDSISIEKTRPAIINTLKDNLFKKHFLFLGYSMEDLDFETIFNLIKKIQGSLPLSSYATVVDVSDEKIEILKKKGIVPLPLNGDVLIDALHNEVHKK